MGISEHQAKTMSEFVCGECAKARDKKEIYCLCRQPYDDSQFYIGCEGCSEWFHGRCVGILQVEAEKIDEYLCPRCEPNSALNKANLKPLSTKEFPLLQKLLKQIMVIGLF